MAKLFPKVAATFYTPPVLSKSCNFSTFVPTLIILSIIIILLGMNQNLIVLLIWIFLVTNDIAYLSFHVIIDHFCISSRDLYLQTLCPVFHWAVF